MREIYSMNPEWKFHLGDIELHNFAAIHEGRFKAPEWMKAGNHGLSKPSYPDAEWREVDLPHDFVVEGVFSPDANQVHGSLPVDVAWYRKVFELPQSDVGRRLSLEFDGIYRDCEIWLNGHLVGRHLSGYTSFSFDVTELCNYGGHNALAIRVDARGFELWSYEGGGIYRDVRLVKTQPVHVPYHGLCVRTEVANEVAPKVADFSLELSLRNDGRAAAEVQLRTVVCDAEGVSVLELEAARALDALCEDTVTLAGALASPSLWSPESPYLYSVKTELRVAGELVDVVSTSFGVRSICFDAKKGVLLNGRSIKLKGLCNHQDHAGVGIAIPYRLQEWRVEQMKWMGCNAMRTAHNPPTPALLEICDRLGILVMDEVRMPGTSDELMGQMESLIRRDRNHPCVMLWSLGNEEMLIQENVVGARILQRMQDRAHQLDPTRSCTYSANCDFNEIAANFEQHGFQIDVFGANYTARRGEDGELRCEGARYDEFHQRFPNLPLLAGESGGSGATRGLYGREQYDGAPHFPDSAALGIDNYVDLNPAREGDSTAYNETMTPWGRSVEDTWKDCAERDFLGGTFLWTGFDYRGETYPFGWPAVITRYGLMDLCGYPKDVFYYHQAWWTETPVLHLFPHWNWAGREGELIDVWCYGNCAEVELWLNDVSLGRQSMPVNGKLVWHVPYTAGKLRAIGYDTSGEAYMERLIETVGEAKAVRLVPDRERIAADGVEALIVRAEIVDAEGRVVPTASNKITFDLPAELNLLGVGNGNPVSHEPEQANYREAYHGLAQLILRSGSVAGQVQLTARAEGLAAHSITIKLVAIDPELPWIRSSSAEQEDSIVGNSIDGAL